MIIVARFRPVHRRFVISRGKALAAIATFATCAMSCSSSSPQQNVFGYAPVEPPFYVVPPIAVASPVDAATSDSGDASTTDAETGVDAQVTDAALDGNAALDSDAGDTGADAPAGDATPLELDAAPDAPVDADR
jgi:hypothetical protein